MEPVSFDSAACINILSLILEDPHKLRKEKSEKKNKGARFEIEYLASFRVCGDTFQHSTSHRNLLGTGEEKNVQRKRRNTLMLPMYYIYTHTHTQFGRPRRRRTGGCCLACLNLAVWRRWRIQLSLLLLFLPSSFVTSNPLLSPLLCFTLLCQ